MLSKQELLDIHDITTKVIGKGRLQFERFVGSKSELGERTMDCIGVNMLFRPELFNPVFSIFDNKEPIRKGGDDNDETFVCVCGCSLCKKLFLTHHIKSGHQFWVGSSCIEKNRRNVEKRFNELVEKLRDGGLTIKQRIKLEELYKILYNAKIEYDKFHRYILDEGRYKCVGVNCNVDLYTTNGKNRVKNITNEDYRDGNPLCFCCKEKRLFECKCINCDKKLIYDAKYNVNTTDRILYKKGYCGDCGNNEVLHKLVDRNYCDPEYLGDTIKYKIRWVDDAWYWKGYLSKMPPEIKINTIPNRKCLI